MLRRFLKLRSVQIVANPVAVISHNFSDSKGLKNTTPVRDTKGSYTPHRSINTGAPATNTDSWTEVVDKQSGQIYYWNKVTNETTPLGAPKPNNDEAAHQEVSRGKMGEIGGLVAKVIVFGASSAAGLITCYVSFFLIYLWW
mmetsp:Transcript_41580/g.82703  ORF Transcript_41580/g.82703 Transcript_41580/m.82703 type:complete len:142 (-) Transcript_41580:188-613(-)